MSNIWQFFSFTISSLLDVWICWDNFKLILYIARIDNRLWEMATSLPSSEKNLLSELFDGIFNENWKSNKIFTFFDLYFYPNIPLQSAQASEDWNIIVAQFVIMKTQSLFVRGKTLFLILETRFFKWNILY